MCVCACVHIKHVPYRRRCQRRARRPCICCMSITQGRSQVSNLIPPPPREAPAISSLSILVKSLCFFMALPPLLLLALTLLDVRPSLCSPMSPRACCSAPLRLACCRAVAQGARPTKGTTHQCLVGSDIARVSHLDFACIHQKYYYG